MRCPNLIQWPLWDMDREMGTGMDGGMSGRMGFGMSMTAGMG